MIYLVGSYKGGSGKTTTATNLAVFLGQQGRKVLLVDGDEQQTLTYWYEARTASGLDVSTLDLRSIVGAALRDELPTLAKGYDDVVVDVAGRDSTTQRAALTLADVYLVPFVPRPPDLWTFGLVRDLVAKAKEVNPSLRTYAFLTRADRYSEASEALVEETVGSLTNVQRLVASLGNRVAFSNAFNWGQSVLEYKPADAKARAEVTSLFTDLQTAIHEKA
jgi:chromosome partitioning protein